jgi:RNA polymerase sigma factor for flagellar operon FliA
MEVTQNEQERDLWQKWSRHRDAGSKAQLLQHYEWIVRFAVNRILRERAYSSDLSRDDLTQHGTVGLLEAIDRFDPARSDDFSGFAKKRVHGAIVDGIDRSSDVRAQLAAVRDMRAARARALAEQSAGKDRLARLADVAIGLAIGIMLEDTALFIDEETSSLQAYSSNELGILRQQFKRLVDGLPDRQRQILRYHYYDDLPFVDIANLLGVTKARISQLHAAALREARERLAKLELFDDRL